MPDISWSTRPHEVLAAAREAAKKSKDGRGLTALQRAYWETNNSKNK
jgi:hypothetical protein